MRKNSNEGMTVRVGEMATFVNFVSTGVVMTETSVGDTSTYIDDLTYRV